MTPENLRLLEQRIAQIWNETYEDRWSSLNYVQRDAMMMAAQAGYEFATSDPPHQHDLHTYNRNGKTMEFCLHCSLEREAR